MSDAAYNTVQSFHSDSAVSFSIFLNHLPDMCSQQPPDVLMRAMQVRAWRGVAAAVAGVAGARARAPACAASSR
jgi:hypothetical protein